MKKVLFIVTVLCICLGRPKAQTCYTGDYTFTTQAQFENIFYNYLPVGCTTWDGNLTLNTDGITNLDPLLNLTTITGDLRISGCTTVSNLQGLTNLDSIGGNFHLSSIDYLEDLDGLENLSHISGNLEITQLPHLSSIQGLSGLTYVGGDMELKNLYDLTSLHGLENLQTIEGEELNIINNGLVHFQGFGPTEIHAQMYIGDNHDLMDFSGLENVTYINSLWVVDNENLTSFEGLDNLAKIENELNITSWYSLTSFEGLENLKVVGTIMRDYFFWGLDDPHIDLSGLEALDSITQLLHLELIGLNSISALGNDLDYLHSVYIRSDSLKTLDGLEGLEEIAGDAHFECYYLEDITALSNLTRVEGDFILHGEAYYSISIDNLEGLQNLEYVGGNLMFRELEITTLAGLESLKYAGTFTMEWMPHVEGLEGFPELDSLGSLVMYRNYSHNHLDGFPSSITTLKGDLRITSNTVLTDIQALAGIQNIEGNVEITYNDKLAVCNILPICTKLNTPGLVEIHDNFQGCNTPAEVSGQCGQLFSMVTGSTFFDENCDGILNIDDILLPDEILSFLTTGYPFSASQSDGTYSAFLEPEAIIDFTWQPDYEGFHIDPLFYSITTSDLPELFEDYNFSLCPDSSFVNFNVTLDPLNVARPGFSHYYQIYISNEGSMAANGTLQFDFSDLDSLDYITILEAPGGMINGDEVEWVISDLNPFEMLCFEVLVEMSAMTPLGTIIFPRAEAINEPGIYDANPNNNEAIVAQEVVGSYDPNDKIAIPGQMDTVAYAAGESIDYLIRFQNTGTYPATFVEVLDTIAPNLDLSTFRMISASHSYVLSFPDERVIKWRFDDINLPDSTSNEPASHGFIKFSIDPIDGLALNDVLSNRAGIYFDFNAPIITNYATTEIVLPEEPLRTNPIETLEFSLFPNPSDGQVQVTIPHLNSLFVEMEIFDAKGELKMKQSNLFANELMLDLDNYTPGVYFIRIKTDGKTGVRKFILK